MSKLFIISEEEKKRILNLHEVATKKHYLLEQQTETPQISYIITASASNVPMRSVTLNKEQGFPLPKDAKPNDVYMYELTLSEALQNNFANATVLNKVAENNRDQIIFGNSSIVNTGSIRIPINQNTINQKIKVSGNGALVLSRAANEYPNKLGGIMILQLSAKQLDSGIVMLEKLGIGQNNIVALFNSTLDGLVYQMSNETGKKQVDPRFAKYVNFPNVYWGAIKDFSGSFIPVNIDWSEKINQYKNTLDSSNYKTKYDEISKVIKNEILVPGLNQLPTSVKNLILTNYPSIPKDLVDQFLVSLNNTIKTTNDYLSSQYIKNYFDKYVYVTSRAGESKPGQKPEIKSTETKYKEGKG